MWSILDITVTSLVAAVTPRTEKIIKNGLLKEAENFLQNGILHFYIVK